MLHPSQGWPHITKKAVAKSIQPGSADSNSKSLLATASPAGAGPVTHLRLHSQTIKASTGLLPMSLPIFPIFILSRNHSFSHYLFPNPPFLTINLHNFLLTHTINHLKHHLTTKCHAPMLAQIASQQSGTNLELYTH